MCQIFMVKIHVERVCWVGNLLSFYMDSYYSGKHFKILSFSIVAVLTMIPTLAYAGGPSQSEAFLLCHDAADVALFPKNLGSSIRMYAYHIETAGKGHLGRETVVDSDLTSLSEQQGILAKCSNYTQSAQELLHDEIRDWVKSNQRVYEQRSIFIFTPYSEQNEKFVREANIYRDPYDKLVFKIKDNWIIAYTTYPYFYPYQDFAGFLIALLGAVLFVLGLRYIAINNVK